MKDRSPTAATSPDAARVTIDDLRGAARRRDLWRDLAGDDRAAREPPPEKETK